MRPTNRRESAVDQAKSRLPRQGPRFQLPSLTATSQRWRFELPRHGSDNRALAEFGNVMARHDTGPQLNSTSKRGQFESGTSDRTRWTAGFRHSVMVSRSSFLATQGRLFSNGLPRQAIRLSHLAARPVGSRGNFSRKSSIPGTALGSKQTDGRQGGAPTPRSSYQVSAETGTTRVALPADLAENSPMRWSHPPCHLDRDAIQPRGANSQRAPGRVWPATDSVRVIVRIAPNRDESAWSIRATVHRSNPIRGNPLALF